MLLVQLPTPLPPNPVPSAGPVSLILRRDSYAVLESTPAQGRISTALHLPKEEDAPLDPHPSTEEDTSFRGLPWGLLPVLGSLSSSENDPVTLIPAMDTPTFQRLSGWEHRTPSSQLSQANVECKFWTNWAKAQLREGTWLGGGGLFYRDLQAGHNPVPIIYARWRMKWAKPAGPGSGDGIQDASSLPSPCGSPAVRNEDPKPLGLSSLLRKSSFSVLVGPSTWKVP